MKELSLREAICAAVDEEMERDPSVFVMGEDVGIYGGLHAKLRGLFQRLVREIGLDVNVSESRPVRYGG